MGGWTEGWLWDLRTTGRSLLRRPGFAALVVGALAMGIGANGAIFEVLDQVVLRPLPFEGGERMVFVMDHDVERGFSFAATQAEYERWKEASRTLESLEPFQAAGAVLTGRGPATRVGVTRVSHHLLDMIGLTPVRGRDFTPDDAAPAAPAVAMIHEDYWRAAFGGDPGIVGTTVVLSEETREIVGVWPREGRIQVDEAPDFFTPLTAGSEMSRSTFTLLLGRMAPGVDTGEVESELTGLMRGVTEEGDADDKTGTETARAIRPYRFLGADFIRGLWILYAGVGLLLLVAAVNAATLLLDRAVDREGELGVRMALGGSASRITRQFLLESGLLVGVATVLGVLLSRLGVTALAALAPADVPAEVVTAGGGRVGSYAALLAVATVLVCGLVPALHLRSPEVRRLLTGGGGGRGGARRSRPLQTMLVATQVAMAVILVVGSSLTLRSLTRLASVDVGFDAGSTAMLSVRAPGGSEGEAADRQALFRDLLHTIRETPGVVSAAANSTLPLNYTIQPHEPTLLDEPREPVPGRFSSSASSSPDFLRTLGIPVLRGRDFNRAEMDDPESATTVLVNEAFARSRGGDVLGRRLTFPDDSVGRTIVGVVGDVRSFGLEDEADRIQVYYPHHGFSRLGSQRFHLRADGDPGTVLARVRERILSVAPDVLVTDARTGRDLIRERTDEHRFLALLLAAFGSVCLLLALAGVYGAISLHVRRRTRATGIEIALGAGTARVSRGILGAGLRPVLLGVAAGLPAALFLSRYLGDVLFRTDPVDPLSLAVAVLLPTGAALVACLAPARRAVRVDPVEALRSE